MKPTRDVLPEHKVYQDTGCRIHPACLTCPLDACIYDGDDVQRRANRQAATDEAIRRTIQMAEQGRSVQEIARVLGVGRRTVHRYKAMARQ